MKKNIDFVYAREMLLSRTCAMECERVDLDDAFGRILAETIEASENIPPFDRSPYDGYAFRSEDSINADTASPVKLKIIGCIAAGDTWNQEVGIMQAVKIMTGAPIPEGTDAVVMYEKTVFTNEEVSVFSPALPGENIIFSGEDVKKGDILAHCGEPVDAGICGMLAAQGITRPCVYKKPVAGIISTGSELVEADTSEGPGKIRNTNRYTLAAALKKDGCQTSYIGTAPDDAAAIAVLIKQALDFCDIVFLTGGVSAGDLDLTPTAMELAGCRLLFKGVDIKPGMACCYGMVGDKPVCALSGNPASSLTNYLMIARPSVRKIAGYGAPVTEEIDLKLIGSFPKKSRSTRFLRGKLRIKDATACIEISRDQGNIVISSAAGCNVIATIPAGSGPIAEGTVLKGFII